MKLDGFCFPVVQSRLSPTQPQWGTHRVWFKKSRWSRNLTDDTLYSSNLTPSILCYLKIYVICCHCEAESRLSGRMASVRCPSSRVKPQMAVHTDSNVNRGSLLAVWSSILQRSKRSSSPGKTFRLGRNLKGRLFDCWMVIPHKFDLSSLSRKRRNESIKEEKHDGMKTRT